MKNYQLSNWVFSWQYHPINLTPTCNIPSSSNGLSRASWPFITDLSMSIGNDCLCTNLTIPLSASVTSDTDKGVVLSFNCIFELVLLSACDFGCVSLWKPRISHATNLRSRSHLKQRWNRELQKYFCTTVAPIVIFSLLTPLLLSKSASEASVGCGGHLSLFFHKNSAPFLHFSNFLVSEALIPREA